MRKRCPIVIVGMGNELLGDEGIGVTVARTLSSLAGRPRDVQVVEAGGSPLGLVHAIARRRKAVIVDCARMNEPPGTIRRFSPREVVSRKSLSGLSAHEGDVLDTLATSRMLGECPEEVVLFGIEPASMEPGAALSPVLRERLAEYVAAVGSELGWLIEAETP